MNPEPSTPNEMQPPEPPPARKPKGRFRWTAPAGLAMRGVMLALPFAALHLAGARESTTIVSGTSADGSPPTAMQAGLAAAYVISWFAAILGGPILAIAAGLLAATDRLLQSFQRGDIGQILQPTARPLVGDQVAEPGDVHDRVAEPRSPVRTGTPAPDR